GKGVQSDRSGVVAGISSLEPGTAVTLDIERDGRQQQLRAVLEPYPTPAETAARHRKAAERGEAWAQREVAKLYASGRGVSSDEAEGLRWTRKAAEQDEGEAIFQVGYALEKGRGVARDDAEAATWYRRAADRGHGMARNNLGVLYRRGRGVAGDDAEAAKWYRL